MFFFILLYCTRISILWEILSVRCYYHMPVGFVAGFIAIRNLYSVPGRSPARCLYLKDDVIFDIFITEFLTTFCSYRIVRGSPFVERITMPCHRMENKVHECYCHAHFSAMSLKGFVVKL